MNESAVRLEEQIISLFYEWETEICQGWILKKWAYKLLSEFCKRRTFYFCQMGFYQTALA